MIASAQPKHRANLALSITGLIACVGLHAADWPQWRGPDRSNASRETGLLQQWPTNGPPLDWRATGIGLGIHSVSLADNRVFTIGNRDGAEYVFALDAWTGEKLWATRLGNSIQENPLMRWLSQRSPTVEGDRLYTLSVRGELVCLRVADGERLWQRSYPEDFGARRPVWGFCDYPLVDGDRLICSPFSDTAAIAALDKQTGAIVWKTSLDELTAPGYAALIRTRAAGVAQFVLFHGRGLAGFAADDGRLLWRHERPRTRTASSYTPIPHGDLILSPNGYGGGLVLIQLRRDEAGFTAEAIASSGGAFDAFQDGSAVLDERLYIIERGRPTCIDVTTASRLWGIDSTNRAGRAALTWADGHLYIRNADGEVMLMKTLPDGIAEKGRFQIPEHERSIGVTSPVVANGRLWLRDNNRLFCYDIGESALAADRPPPRHVAVGLTDRELSVDPDAPRPPRAGVNRAPDAVYVPTPHDIVERMLQAAAPKKTDLLVDLGSGDGRYLIAAAKKFGCKAIGYEIDERLVELSREAVAKEELGELVSIEQRDIFTLDLRGADVVTVFLYPRLMERLIPQLEKLKPGSRILSHQFEMPGVRPDMTLMVESKEDGEPHRILLWTTPLRKE